MSGPCHGNNCWRHGITLETSPSLESRIVDRVRIFKDEGLSEALVVAAIESVVFQRSIAPKLESARIPYELINAKGRVRTTVRGAIALRRAVRKFRPWLITRNPEGSLTH